MPSLKVNPIEFLDELFTAKIKVLGLSVGEDFVKIVILACVVLSQCQRVKDGQKNRETEGMVVSAVLRLDSSRRNLDGVARIFVLTEL